MRKTILSTLTFVALLFISQNTAAQNKSDLLFYVSAGGFTTSANAEKLLTTKGANTVYANVGIGEIYDSSSQLYSAVSLQWLLGRRNIQFESGLGVGIGFEETELSQILKLDYAIKNPKKAGYYVVVLAFLNLSTSRLGTGFNSIIYHFFYVIDQDSNLYHLFN